MGELILGLIFGLVGGLLLGLGLSWRLGFPKEFIWKRNQPPRPIAKFLSPSRADLKPAHLLQVSSHGRSLLVPLRNDMAYPEQAIRAGLELALHSGQPLNFMVFLEVPRTHNLESGLDEELEAAFQLLERAEQQAQRAGLSIRTSATKVRNYLLGVAESALELKAGLIILERSGEPHSVNRLSLDTQASQLASKTGCNILLLNRAMAQAEILPAH